MSFWPRAHTGISMQFMDIREKGSPPATLAKLTASPRHIMGGQITSPAVYTPGLGIKQVLQRRWTSCQGTMSSTRVSRDTNLAFVEVLVLIRQIWVFSCGPVEVDETGAKCWQETYRRKNECKRLLVHASSTAGSCCLLPPLHFNKCTHTLTKTKKKKEVEEEEEEEEDLSRMKRATRRGTIVRRGRRHESCKQTPNQQQKL